MSIADQDTLNWYVVHTHPQQEERASGNLETLGIETLSPRLRVNRYNEFTGKVIYVPKPLFPSYIFACFRINAQYHKVRFTRGVHSVVGFCGTPAPVEEEIVDLVRVRMGQDGFVKTLEEFKAGDEVVIREGRFKNFYGVFESHMKDSERVRVLLNTVSFQAHVVVDATLVRKVSTAGLAS